MKVTFILKNKSDAFFEGCDITGMPGVNNLKSVECYKYINGLSCKPEYAITKKIESGEFRHAVELNKMLKLPHNITHKIEPRKGYVLASFEIVKASI